ncbi:hypothetical protein [Cohnella kolymensis]|uniref:hypothetical protein n=1 Tax=Cohnella kolymensis TaxID=1590652 RepID=UPI001269CD62|nr:hypothetical protein [Cohnella kolymensis]
MPDTTNPRDVYGALSPIHAAGHQFVLSEYFHRLKMAFAADPLLYYQYAAQEHHHKTLAYRYLQLEPV